MDGDEAVAGTPGGHPPDYAVSVQRRGGTAYGDPDGSAQDGVLHEPLERVVAVLVAEPRQDPISGQIDGDPLEVVVPVEEAQIEGLKERQPGRARDDRLAARRSRTAGLDQVGPRSERGITA
jgi:hypothetical protein